MKLNVFLSWSGTRSRMLAKELSRWLPRVIQASKPWMSDEYILKGERWSSKIGDSLGNHDIGIVCVTPENVEAKWLLFEAGALSKALDHARVCPVLLGMRPSEFDGPLSMFQATVFERSDMFKLVSSLNAKLEENRVNEDVLEDAFDRCWPGLESKVAQITSAEIEADSTTLPSTIKVFAKYGFPEPAVGSSAFFKEGFESHHIYDIAAQVARQRLYQYGRKNRKLFDKEHWDFLSELPDRINDGFDFKCLFLDPDSPPHVLESAHSDPDFRDQLLRSIDKARKVLDRFGIDFSKHCRTYRCHRSVALTVVDDAVLFTPVKLDGGGTVQRLTKCSFTVINSHSRFGQELVDGFLAKWDEGGSFN